MIRIQFCRKHVLIRTQYNLVCLRADHVNFMSLPDIDGEMELKAKIRYSHSGSMCKVTRTGEDQIHCVFEEPVRAVTPGQAVVLYDGDYVAGGGIII